MVTAWTPCEILPSTDAELVAACGTVIDHPKAAPPGSFELHAPLELLGTRPAPRTHPGAGTRCRQQARLGLR